MASHSSGQTQSQMCMFCGDESCIWEECQRNLSSNISSLDRHTRIDTEGNTNLHRAVQHGRKVYVAKLLDCGVDPNLENAEGMNAAVYGWGFLIQHRGNEEKYANIWASMLRILEKQRENKVNNLHAANTNFGKREASRGMCSLSETNLPDLNPRYSYGVSTPGGSTDLFDFLYPRSTSSVSASVGQEYSYSDSRHVASNGSTTDYNSAASTDRPAPPTSTGQFSSKTSYISWKKYECGICGERFSLFRSIQAHMNSPH